MTRSLFARSDTKIEREKEGGLTKLCERVEKSAEPVCGQMFGDVCSGEITHILLCRQVQGQGP